MNPSTSPRKHKTPKGRTGHTIHSRQIDCDQCPLPCQAKSSNDEGLTPCAALMMAILDQGLPA